MIKIASIFTDFKQNTLVFRKLSSDWRFYGVIFLVSVLLIFFLSFGVFVIEENIGSKKYTNFSESLAFLKTNKKTRRHQAIFEPF